MEIGGINYRAFETFLKEKGREVKSPEDFADALKEFVLWVNSQQENAKNVKEAVLRGEDVPLHRMVIEFEKAGVALNLMIEVRNRLLEGYQELLRMQV
ncbi:flagellar hook-basal body complex protein FliE [Hydrogenivirga sp. 128-5-R1-1]|uniref:flagellar hook-basal body complex protein FliE n=1 Tax=Hydrogenivirga sp. 128-5-R1-1 TaxID=392423 RepID=UPI00015F37E6|nr:flagellar hook-basal body complex protein FliE [Hydrogenivirga sp. 128-5-R1-1]EDP76465.1 flagellar hook-basal body protein [Hydrogenivirga sp. 128-5-R1-1]